MSEPADMNSTVIAKFRAHDGTVTSRPFGRSLVLVHHTGARSGIDRVTPVMAIRADPDTWLIAASKARTPENPAWYHNLLANPDTTIEVPGEGVVDIHVTELTGAERDAAWARFTALSPGFATYEARTTRTIPVLALTRR